MVFPPEDFHNPYQGILHPARPFITACLCVDDLRRFMEHCDRMFRQFSLVPEPMQSQQWGGPL
jgi:hypothetical protein